jgi:hypothetical protein
MWHSPGLDGDTYWHGSQGRSRYGPLSPPLNAHLHYGFPHVTDVGVSDHMQFHDTSHGEEHIDDDALPGKTVGYLANRLTWL